MRFERGAPKNWLIQFGAIIVLCNCVIVLHELIIDGKCMDRLNFWECSLSIMEQCCSGHFGGVQWSRKQRRGPIETSMRCKVRSTPSRCPRPCHGMHADEAPARVWGLLSVGAIGWKRWTKHWVMRQKTINLKKIFIVWILVVCAYVAQSSWELNMKLIGPTV